jgi:molybdate transport system substrate-binding protein
MAAFVSSGCAAAQEVTVMSSNGFAASYKLIAPVFETASGAHLKSIWGPSMGPSPASIPTRLANEEYADVVIMASTELDALAKKGLVVEGSQVALARSRIGMAVRAGAPVPDIGSISSFRKTLLNAKSIAYSSSASGVYLSTELFRRMGIESEVAAKSREIVTEPVGEVVARGEVEIGFQQMSELRPINGITIVGPIPDELQKITLFAAGVVAKSHNKKAAQSLIRFLASSSACNAMEQTGLEPIACLHKRQ